MRHHSRLYRTNGRTPHSAAMKSAIALGAAARQYAVAHFDIRHTVRGYEQLYESLLKGG